MDVSIVVCTYGRLDGLKRLVSSVRREFSKVNFEIVVVASDALDSEKCFWASEQPDLVLLCLADRAPGKKRAQSLYYYENLGIQKASGDWIFITNDDSEFDIGTVDCFLEMANEHDVLVLPAELDDSSLGKRAPVIGHLTENGKRVELVLLDFAFIKSSILETIGPSDENLDWYGAGVDRAIRVALLPDSRVGILSSGGLTHHLDLENRTPPHSYLDLKYLDDKWGSFAESRKGLEIDFGSKLKSRILPLFWYTKVWPSLALIRRRIAGNLGH